MKQITKEYIKAAAAVVCAIIFMGGSILDSFHTTLLPQGNWITRIILIVFVTAYIILVINIESRSHQHD